MTKPATQNEPQEVDVRNAFSAILGFEDELLSERGTYMQRCQGIRGQIADVYDTAKSKGITKKVLKATVKAHLLEAKAKACRADLEADEQHEYEMLAGKLGGLAELPLGKSALEKAAMAAAKPDEAAGKKSGKKHPGVGGDVLDQLARA